MPLLACPECKADVSDRPAACPRCGYPVAAVVAGPAPQGPQAAPDRGPSGGASFVERSAFAVALLLGACMLLLLGGSLAGSGPGGSASLGPEPTLAPATTRSGEASVDLGRRSSTFGSQGQAEELLQLIDSEPEKARFTISYRSEFDAVVVRCDLAADTLVRVHTRPDGRGTAEQWNGHILFRLRSAARGGSLEDTPSGHSVGTFERF